MKTLMRALAGAIAVSALAACAAQLPPPMVTFDNVQRLRETNTPALALGAFTRGAELSARQDQSISIRADSLRPPSGGTFSAYLGNVIQAELAGAGKLDPASPLVLSGELTRSEIDG
ncbi:MAG TPA: hypothetical protein PLS69_15260, partial [Terricaulis sp.]|nr:hypothetical protein [Terricaulis sp.]